MKVLFFSVVSKLDITSCQQGGLTGGKEGVTESGLTPDYVQAGGEIRHIQRDARAV